MKEAADWLQQNQVTQVECIVPDMNGTAKGKLVPAEQILDTEIRIAEAIFGQDAIGQWCHDEELFQVADVDMVMTPDYASLTVQPWSEKTANCICDSRTLAGEPLAIEEVVLPAGSVVVMWTHSLHAVNPKPEGSETRWALISAFRNPHARDSAVSRYASIILISRSQR